MIPVNIQGLYALNDPGPFCRNISSITGNNVKITRRIYIRQLFIDLNKNYKKQDKNEGYCK